MINCEKHNVLLEYNDLERGKSEWKCPECEKERLSGFHKMINKLPVRKEIFHE